MVARSSQSASTNTSKANPGETGTRWDACGSISQKCVQADTTFAACNSYPERRPPAVAPPLQMSSHHVFLYKASSPL